MRYSGFVAAAGLAMVAGSVAASAAEKPPAAFNQCKACHMLVMTGDKVTGAKNGVGPSLWGIVGRPAGTVEGFKYSKANKESGLTWDEATLDVYLTDPKAKVPGTTMAFAGFKPAAGKEADPADPKNVQRKEVIEYLKTLHD